MDKQASCDQKKKSETNLFSRKGRDKQRKKRKTGGGSRENLVERG